MATLTTSPQLVGKNENGTIRTYLYAWYDGQSGNSCTVHTRLRCKCVGTTYVGANKTYFMQLGGYNSGVKEWKYVPLNDGQEYTVAEAAQSYSGGSQISAAAGFWSYVYGSADIGLSSATYVPTFNSKPTGLSVSVAEVYTTGAKFNVSISSYGNPSGVNGRWIEAGIAGQNAWQSPSLRSAIIANTMSAQIMVDNSSTKTQTLTIRPNTQYYYGGYAWNTVLGTDLISGKLVTKAEAPAVLFVSSTPTSATFSYSVPADGGFYNRIIQYTLNGTTWYNAITITGSSAKSGTFTVNGLLSGASYTMQTRMSTTAGKTTGGSVSFDTLVGEADNKNILYGSVNDRAKEVRIIYGGVDDEARPITRFYGPAPDPDFIVAGGIVHVFHSAAVNGLNATMFNYRMQSDYPTMWAKRDTFWQLEVLSAPSDPRRYSVQMIYRGDEPPDDLGTGDRDWLRTTYGILVHDYIPQGQWTKDYIYLKYRSAARLIHQAFGHIDYS